ncbi:CRISPR-associated endonuclease Cas2 [Candidatus Poriferisodalis sp.]|uniref:CRISPR-associated endonuclease Cas2 n=1 Tax=Candidatus Poriferisodalis sp. TaxID=3101277 RepID=UPI003B0140F6
MDVLVTYDIATDKKSDAKRLKRVSDLCAEYGQRVQYSVFECRVTPAALAKLRADLEDTIDWSRDSISLYRFRSSIQEAKTTLGVNLDHHTGNPWIL